jgi:bifunctional DNA-binding transcriptional regulator/antitoxin component of YhaV-PrlF toxin-antitoxin module
MSLVVEVDDFGAITVPAELLQAQPHARFMIERTGNDVVLRPVQEQFTEHNTAEQRVNALQT